MQHQATHDALTQLPNRALLTDRLAQAIGVARRSGEVVAVMFFDLSTSLHYPRKSGRGALLIGGKRPPRTLPALPPRWWMAPPSALFHHTVHPAHGGSCRCVT
ncbi:MAG: GGDEF domain-containing protein [Gammaproteobacteria bacterium]|nr:GGDEF domain-containing protein [Gammaproteobacteria bacterium]